MTASIYTTVYNSQLSNNGATLYTSSGGDNIRQLLAVNADTSPHTVTITAVRKGGSPTDAYASPIAAAVPIPAGGTAELINPGQLANGGIVLRPGDFLYGDASAASEVTLLAYGT